MMTDLRRLSYLLDTNDIHIRPGYIYSVANILTDTLSRELDTEDWQLNLRLFAHIKPGGGRTLSIDSRLCLMVRPSVR
jgi:hypothetical protein